jgi:RNA polymerase sigma-70 factor (ECF subfamily)
LKLWETRDQLEISHVKTYLFHTAKHIILNHLRDKDKHSSLLGEWAERQQENIRKQADESERERRLSTLQKAIDTLPAKCKELFILNKQENLTYKQIAELKQISIKTVENQMTIAFKKIRTLMDVSWK